MNSGVVSSPLAAAFAELSEEHREVITLARIVQLPRAAIAASMGRSEAAVRQLLVRAPLQLAQQLKRRGVVLP
ncbi:MAG: sigma factor-like helix-turn-helix DNA-binding protein [Planctomycetota bacterium]